MFGIFRRRNAFNDSKKQQFAHGISLMLKVQMAYAPDCPIEDTHGNVNNKALGYIYGFIDSALRTIGQDMSDVSVGVPVTFQVLDELFPGRAEEYIQHLANNIGVDEEVTRGVMTGGQQYVDLMNKKIEIPMGLARYLVRDHPGIEQMEK
jgi:hypothetical protein